MNMSIRRFRSAKGEVMKLENELIIACTTLHDEIEYCSEQSGIERECIWLEAQLHLVPANLKAALEEALANVDDRIERVLLGYGNCSNSVVGLQAGDFELIIPRLDDCISILMGSQKRRQAFSDAHHCIYLTKGWFEAGSNIVDQYQQTLEQYDEEMARYVLEQMYAHYENMAFLDTGLYDVPELQRKTCETCEMLGLKQIVEPGTLEFVRDLVRGPWPEERFVTVKPHARVQSDAFSTYV